MAAFVEIFIEQGANLSSTVTVTDPFGYTVNLSTYSAASQIRKSYTSSTAYNFTVGLGNNGVITLSMNAATSSTITAGRYLYDLEVQDANSVRSRLVEGIVSVTPEITR